MTILKLNVLFSSVIQAKNWLWYLWDCSHITSSGCPPPLPPLNYGGIWSKDWYLSREWHFKKKIYGGSLLYLLIFKKKVTMFLLLILKAIAERRGMGRGGGGKGYFPFNLLKGEGQAYLSPRVTIRLQLLHFWLQKKIVAEKWSSCKNCSTWSNW